MAWGCAQYIKELPYANAAVLSKAQAHAHHRRLAGARAAFQRRHDAVTTGQPADRPR